MPKVKMTVVKRAAYQELIDTYIRKDPSRPEFGACEKFEDGQEFVIDGFPGMPENFPCDWAWSDIQRDVAMIMFGGNPPWMKEPGIAVACCSDGLRPVSFLIERIED